MGLDDIRNLLAEARRALVEWRKELPAGKSQKDSARRLALFKDLIAAADELLKQQEEFAGRLRRTSPFGSGTEDTRVDHAASPPLPPSTPDDLSMNTH